jgi:hydroxyacylglutathione hydrolase
VTFSGQKATVMENPGHTTGAISFFMKGGATTPHVYTGDTLFLAGCGRLFEGTPEMMWRSMRLLRALPTDTLVHCGHEYTASNLQFALHLEPDNEAVRARLDQVRDQVSRGEATVPSPLSVELETNPFMRADDPLLLESIRQHHSRSLSPGVETFAFVRALKDNFRPQAL